MTEAFSALEIIVVAGGLMAGAGLTAVGIMAGFLWLGSLFGVIFPD